MNKYATFEEFANKFEQVCEIPQQKYQFAEIYRHSVHKNFYFVNP